MAHPSYHLCSCAPARRSAAGLGLVVCGLIALPLLFGCKETSGGATKETSAAPAAEPERFSFSLPKEYARIELSGEGSETMSIPAGARTGRANRDISIEAGSDFAIDVRADSPALSELTSKLAGAKRVLEERDLVIFGSPAGYAFVLVRELVPEWDENQPQRFACSSRGAQVGGAEPRADMRWFPRSAVQNMVAACRTLQLPKLE